MRGPLHSEVDELKRSDSDLAAEGASEQPLRGHFFTRK
jgi:hypothetical protein